MNLTYNADVKENDHAVDATRYAVMAALAGPEPTYFRRIKNISDSAKETKPKIKRTRKTDGSMGFIGDSAHTGIRRSLGAGFGEDITDIDREWAASREPVAYRFTFTVAQDMFDNWFTIDDPATEGADPDLDGKVQAVLRLLDAKRIFITATAYERIHGYSLIVGGFDDAATVEDLKKPRRKGASLTHLQVYSKPQVYFVEKDIRSE